MHLTARAVLVATLLASVPLLPVEGAEKRPTTTDLTVGKTDRWAFAFGTVTPPRPRGGVIVRFARDDGSGFEGLGSTRVPLSDARDANHDGRQESHYHFKFSRPIDGTCRIIAIFPGNDRWARSEDRHEFPCGIPDFGSGTATMTSDTGTVEIDLLIAETDAQRGYGLMYRKWLAPDLGMAFLFPGDTSSSFYMANTLIPLSIAFYDGTGRIVRILDMEPCDDDAPDGCPLYSPDTTYRGALEVNQGAFSEWGVSEGDVITIVQD